MKKKIFSILSILALSIGSLVIPSSLSAKQITGTVTYQDIFPDANFAAVVTQKVGYSKKITDTVTQGELDNIKGTLFASNKSISSLEGIGYLRNLKILYADGNTITEIPEEIKDLTSLEILDLDDNQVSSIPSQALAQTTSLKSITLSQNNLTTIPDDIDAITSASKLNFENNSITYVPESIGNLNRISEINLANNQIGSLPESIGNYTAIQYLYLQHNNLVTLPDSLGNLTSLATLYLNDNQLNAIPSTVANISPTYFYIHNNAITEALPAISGYGYQNYGQVATLEGKSFYLGEAITADDLLPNIVKQSRTGNSNTLSGIGQWKITAPSSTATTIAGDTGTEISSALFTEVGTYTLTFEYTTAGMKNLSGSSYTLPVAINSHLPVIVGVSDKTVLVGETIDLLEGISAEDSEDGDLTASLSVTPASIDTSYPHTEKVTYAITDSHNQVVTAERTITINAAPAAPVNTTGGETTVIKVAKSSAGSADLPKTGNNSIMLSSLIALVAGGALLIAKKKVK